MKCLEPLGGYRHVKRMVELGVEPIVDLGDGYTARLGHDSQGFTSTVLFQGESTADPAKWNPPYYTLRGALRAARKAKSDHQFLTTVRAA